VHLAGGCFRQYRHLYGRHPGAFFLHEFQRPRECELRIGGPERIRIDRRGKLHGWIVVEGRGRCFQHRYTRRATPARYWLGVGCMACILPRPQFVLTRS
jgi:hypothetical protein